MPLLMGTPMSPKPNPVSLCQHLDSQFGDEEELPSKDSSGKQKCPGVGGGTGISLETSP